MLNYVCEMRRLNREWVSEELNAERMSICEFSKGNTEIDDAVNRAVR